MEVDATAKGDPKSMSLDALIKMDKKKTGGKKGNKSDRPNTARSGKGGPQGGRPRFENMKKGGANPFKAKRTGNMISKQNDRNAQNQKKFDKPRPGKEAVQNRRSLKVSNFGSQFICLTKYI